MPTVLMFAGTIWLVMPFTWGNVLDKSAPISCESKLATRGHSQKKTLVLESIKLFNEMAVKLVVSP